MAIKFPSGGIITPCSDPSWQNWGASAGQTGKHIAVVCTNSLDFEYFLRRRSFGDNNRYTKIVRESDTRGLRFDSYTDQLRYSSQASERLLFAVKQQTGSPRLKDIILKCQVCCRRHGRPRKNKFIMDEFRGIEIQTGTVTIVKEQKLAVLNSFAALNYHLTPKLCQECITHISINGAVRMYSDPHRTIQNKYSFKDKGQSSMYVELAAEEKKGEIGDHYGLPEWRGIAEQVFNSECYMPPKMPSLSLSRVSDVPPPMRIPNPIRFRGYDIED